MTDITDPEVQRIFDSVALLIKGELFVHSIVALRELLCASLCGAVDHADDALDLKNEASLEIERSIHENFEHYRTQLVLEKVSPQQDLFAEPAPVVPERVAPPAVSPRELARGTWVHALACRDLVTDLGSLRENAGQIVAPLFEYQRDILIEILSAEFQAVEAELSIDVGSETP